MNEYIHSSGISDIAIILFTLKTRIANLITTEKRKGLENNVTYYIMLDLFKLLDFLQLFRTNFKKLTAKRKLINLLF